MIYLLTLFGTAEFIFALRNCEDEISAVLVIIGACVYVVLFGIVLRPRYSIFAYLLLWISMPKSLYYIPFLVRIDSSQNVNLFLLFEITAMLAICVSALARRVTWSRLPVQEGIKKFLWLCLFVFIVSMISSIYRVLKHDIPFVPENFSLLNGLIFIYGFIAYIRKFRDIEKIFVIFVLAGIELILEFFYFVYLGLSLPFVHSVIHESGRFNSVAYSDYQTVSFVCYISVCAILYFISYRKMYFLIPLLPLLLLPVINSFQRVGLFVMLFAIGIVIHMALPPRRIKILYFLCMISIVILGYMGYLESMYGSASLYYEKGVRPDFFLLDSMNISLESRLGAILRSLDVFVFAFPFGVGVGNVQHFMSVAFVPSYFGSLSGYSEAQLFYSRISRGAHVTGSHNFYAYILAKNGLLGIIMLCCIFYFVVSSFIAFRRRSKHIKDKYSDASFIAQVCCYSVLMSFSAYYLVQHTPIFYFLIFLFLYLISILPDMEGQPQPPLLSGLLPKLR